MRHQKARGKLSRDSAHRKALMMNLSKEIIEHERIKTSAAKAKAVKPEIERLITDAGFKVARRRQDYTILPESGTQGSGLGDSAPAATTVAA